MRSVRLCVYLFLSCLLLSCSAKLTVEEDAGKAAEYIRSLYFDRDYSLGDKEGERLSNKFPQSTELRAWYLVNMAQNNKAGKALEKAQKMADEYPDDPWSHFALAQTYVSNDEHEKAQDVAEQALSVESSNPDFLWMKAEALPDHERRIAFIDRVKNQVESPENFLAKKGESLFKLSQDTSGVIQKELFNDALAVMENVRNIDSNCFDAWYLPGKYHSQQNNQQKAYQFYKKAVTLSTAVGPHSEYWHLVMDMDQMNSEKVKKIVTADMELLEKRRPASAGMLFSFANHYEMLGMMEKKKAYDQKIVEQFPENEYAEWVLVLRHRDFRDANIKEIRSPNPDPEVIGQYQELLWDYVDHPYHSKKELLGETYRRLFQTYKADPNVSSETLLNVINGIVEYGGIDFKTYGDAAMLLADRGVHLSRAAEIARKGVEVVRKKINKQKEWSYDTEEQYQGAMNRYTGVMYDTLGWVYYHQGEVDSAEKYLTKAYKLNKGNWENRKIIYHLGRLYENKGNLDKAEQYYVDGSRMGEADDNPNVKALKSLYVDRHGNAEGYSEYLAEFDLKTKILPKQNVLANRRENPRPIKPFELNTLQDSTFSSTKLYGSISVINMWGLWCGPCVKEMPDIQKLYEKYEDDPNVQVLTINNDSDSEKVRNWMDERSYDFPVLRSDGYLNELNVKRFPSTWFLNGEGEVIFVKYGYTKELVKEFTWRIEALQSD